MKILAIDPGYERLGIAVLEKSGTEKETLLYSECFKTSSKETFEDRLLAIGNKIDQVVQEHKPKKLVIESLFFAKNTKTALQVAEAKGVITFVAKSAGLAIQELKPNQIKLAVTGDGSADKMQIAHMVKLILDIDTKDLIDDEVDAIAIGIAGLAISSPPSP